MSDEGLSELERLFAAVEAQDAASVTDLVRAGADPNAARKDGWTPLLAAASKGDVAVARAILDGGADPDRLQLTTMEGDDSYDGSISVPFRAERALHPIDVALDGGHEGVAALLAERCRNPWVRVAEGVDPGRQWVSGHVKVRRRDPLPEAARRGFASVVERLLAHRSSPRGALELAVKAVLDGGSHGAVEHRRGAILELLARRGATFHGQDGWRALDAAICLRHAGAVRALVESGVKLDGQRLDAAVRSGSLELVAALIPAGHWVTARDIVDALERREGPSDVIELLEAGPEPESGGPRLTALRWAALGGHLEVLRRLLDGAPAEDHDRALRDAIRCRSPDGLRCLRFLLEGGATLSEALVYEVERHGGDPPVYGELLSHAAARGDHRVLSRVLSRDVGLSLDEALCRAVSRGDERSVRRIIAERGARHTAGAGTHEALVEAAAGGGAVLAAAADLTLHVMRSTSGVRLPGHDGEPVLHVAVSPDARRALSSGEDRSVRLWSLATGRELARIDLEATPGAVAFAPDGRSFLVGTDVGCMLRYGLGEEAGAPQTPLRAESRIDP